MGANLILDQRTSDTSEVRPGQMFNYASTLLLRRTNHDLYETHLHAIWSVAGLLTPDVPLSEAASANLPALALYETTKAINRARSKGKSAKLIALLALPRVIYDGRHSEARSFLGSSGPSVLIPETFPAPARSFPRTIGRSPNVQMQRPRDSLR